jgi:hypothetical protein
MGDDHDVATLKAKLESTQDCLLMAEKELSRLAAGEEDHGADFKDLRMEVEELRMDAASRKEERDSLRDEVTGLKEAYKESEALGQTLARRVLELEAELAEVYRQRDALHLEVARFDASIEMAGAANPAKQENTKIIARQVERMGDAIKDSLVRARGSAIGLAVSAERHNSGGDMPVKHSQLAPPPNRSRRNSDLTTEIRRSEYDDVHDDLEMSNEERLAGQEWIEVKEVHPVPPFGVDWVNSPVIQHLLQTWSRDEEKLRYIELWLKAVAERDILPQSFPRGLHLVSMKREVRDGFLTLVVPLLRQRHQLTVLSRFLGGGHWDLRIKVIADSDGENPQDTLRNRVEKRLSQLHFKSDEVTSAENLEPS